jgi:hypothetical protein
VAAVLRALGAEDAHLQKEPLEEPSEEPSEEPLEDPIEEPLEEPLGDLWLKPFEEPLEWPLEGPVEVTHLALRRVMSGHCIAEEGERSSIQLASNVQSIRASAQPGAEPLGSGKRQIERGRA